MNERLTDPLETLPQYAETDGPFALQIESTPLMKEAQRKTELAMRLLQEVADLVGVQSIQHHDGPQAWGLVLSLPNSPAYALEDVLGAVKERLTQAK